jgi:hypothetical protein
MNEVEPMNEVVQNVDPLGGLVGRQSKFVMCHGVLSVDLRGLIKLIHVLFYYSPAK